MAERELVLDKVTGAEQITEALQELTRRAERAEAELARVKSAGSGSDQQTASGRGEQSDSAEVEHESPLAANSRRNMPTADGGESELRKDSMMAHLLDSLSAGKDIGHYGRLVFAMVARHFLPHEEVLGWMSRDKDFGEEQAGVMLRQVEERDYNPPRRARILEWQAQQAFPILPKPADPDCGNVYRNLKFPEKIYSHIGEYQESKGESEA